VLTPTEPSSVQLTACVLLRHGLHLLAPSALGDGVEQQLESSLVQRCSAELETHFALANTVRCNAMYWTRGVDTISICGT